MHGRDDTIRPSVWAQPAARSQGDVSSDEDNALVATVLAGDVSAFDILYDRYAERVYRIIRGVLSDRDLARDVAQEVFLQAYKALPRFRRTARFGTWLYRIAINRAIDAGRSHGRLRWSSLPATEDGRFGMDEDPAQGRSARVDADDVEKTLASLTPMYRQILVLRYTEEMTIAEIAETLGCSNAAAKVRLHRARLKFKEIHERTVAAADAD